MAKKEKAMKRNGLQEVLKSGWWKSATAQRTLAGIAVVVIGAVAFSAFTGTADDRALAQQQVTQEERAQAVVTQDDNNVLPIKSLHGVDSWDYVGETVTVEDVVSTIVDEGAFRLGEQQKVLAIKGRTDLKMPKKGDQVTVTGIVRSTLQAPPTWLTDTPEDPFLQEDTYLVVLSVEPMESPEQ
jgi:hypothetical protein